MAIVKMKKLRLIVLRDQRDGLSRALMGLGCVQIGQPEGLLSDPETAALFCPERGELAAGRTALSQLQSALRVLDQYAPKKKKLLSARPEVTEREFLDEEALRRDLALAERINEWDSGIRRIQAEESRIRAEIQTLIPWKGLDVPLTGAGTKRTAMALLTAPAEAERTGLMAAMEEITEAAQLIAVSQDDALQYLGLIALREELSPLVEALRKLGCGLVQFPDKPQPAGEIIRRLEEELAALARSKGERTDSIVAVAPKREALRLSADRMAAEVSRREAIERLLGTDSIVLLEGWCPEPEVERLEAVLGGFDCAWELEDPAEEEYPDVPVKLQNGKFARPMNLITEMYSLPAYDGIDPNPLMAPFFVLFYGIMMADMGYGILMMLASVIALKKMRPKGGTKNLLTILGYAGVSTFVFGALTGGFFGDLLPQIAAMINPETAFTALPALFTPLGDTIMILVGSMALGIVQIFTGMIVSVIYKCRNGDGWSALFEEGAWWFILIGVALMVLKIGNIGGVPVVLCIGCLLLVIGQFVAKKSFAGGIAGLFGAVYNGVTGYFGDILSYTRLMALMLAGSIIATVFNTLGAVTGNPILFIVIAMLGNALNFGLNLLGCFVHDLRLQVLEFFGRFYKDGGKAFRPLDIDTKYVDVIKEEL